MYENGQPDPKLQWGWRLLLSALILSAIWLYRNSLYAWAQQPWQKAVLLGFVAVTLLDMLQTIRQPLARSIARLTWRLRTWRRQVAGNSNHAGRTDCLSGSAYYLSH